jgi:hypothetical protein
MPRWFLVAQLPGAGVVFALDGAGDVARMRTATVVSAFIVLRAIFVGWRKISGRWRVTGA